MSVTTYSGDCLTRLALVTASSVDLVIADLPYGTTQASWDQPIDLGRLWSGLDRIVKRSGNVIMFGAQPFTSQLVVSAGKRFRYAMVWRKNRATGHLNARRMPMRAHEDVIVFGRPGAFYAPQMTTGHQPMNYAINERRASKGETSLYGSVRPTVSRAGATDRYPTTVLSFDVLGNDDPTRIHPTQKPVELLKWLVRSYSPSRGVVLDPTMGSGASGVAALEEGRDFIGIESDPSFYAKACFRLARGRV